VTPPTASPDRDLDILCIGEPLVEFAEIGRADERLYRRGFGGDTANVAVAAARQGARVGYATALGDDPFGHEFRQLFEREGIDHRSVALMPGARTGLYFIHYGPEGHVFSYDRAGSAASRMSPADLPAELIARSRVLQVSAISQAISSSCTDAVFAAMRLAKEAGAVVSYDTNLRLALWPLDRARATINAALALADIARPGLDDARQLTGLTSPDEIADHCLGLGCRIVALTLGREGTFIATAAARRLLPAFPIEAVDASGAGDAFTGAFLADWLAHGDPFRAATYGNAAAALKTRGYGAIAPMPRRDEVEVFLRELGAA
jgi:2-dehydro-3-deoxygluconokinase